MYNPEKNSEIQLEDFMESVESADMPELLRLRTQFYDSPERRLVNKLANSWAFYVESLAPESANSRLHHFLKCSTSPEGVCDIDDLTGDLSAENFLRSDNEERAKMVERLREQVEGADRMAA